MEGSNLNIPYRLKPIAIYIASLILMFFIEDKFRIAKSGFSKVQDGNSNLGLIVFFIVILTLPFIWIKHTDLKRGFVIFLLSFLGFLFIYPKIYSLTSGSSNNTSIASKSINGTYYVDEGDRNVKLIVGGKTWYCTVKIQGGNGYVTTDEIYGSVKENNMLIDDRQNIPVGEVDGTYAEIFVYSRQSSLTKISD